VVVEIDEALLVRRKFNVGRVVRQTWVFGGYEVESKLGFIKIVQDRSRETLYSLIHQHIRPGTTIVSDMWASYSTLNDEGFNHLTVNHSLHFVDPVSFATTNHVESTWQKMKQKHKERYGTARKTLACHMCGFMWRQRFGKSLNDFISHINEQYCDF
jgi:hypothetical protein